MYDLLPATRNDSLSSIMGPSTANLLNMAPTPPSTLNFLGLPSFSLTSNIEERRPPYLAGIPPLISFTSLTASGLKTEKKPNKCEELYTGASSSKTKFWSIPPPRTLNPVAPSPTVDTPGNSCTDLTTSVSPKSAGILVNVCWLSSNVLISIDTTLSLDFLEETTTSSV